MAADKSNRNAVRFSRFIRLSWATALGASVSVGVSLFILLGTFLSLSAGRPLTLPYLLLALIALPILLTIAERSGVTSGSTSPYRMARASESIWLTYATGWILIAGYIILSALLALGTASELNIILQAFVEEPLDLSLIAVGVVALIAINNLVGTRFNLRTLTGLVAFGLAIVVVISLQRVWNGQIQSSALSFGRIQKPLNIVTLMTSIFWGFYLVMRTRDQIHRPVKNIFLALLYTASLGIFFGYLGSITLRDYSVRLGVSMQLLERVDPLTLTQQISPATFQLLYAIGGLIILLIGLHFSIINALDLIDGMAQDGFLPSFMQSESKLFKTPLVPILLFSIFSILAIMFIRVELVVGLAALTFLWSVALSHLPFAIRSSPNLPDNRNPRLPFHPLFPGLVVAIGFFMPIYLARQTWWYGLIWIACGILFYLVYARRRGALVRRRDLTIGMVEKPEDEAERENRIMVGIANPRTAGDLIRAGIKIASAKNGTLFVLKILQLADQVPDYLKHNMAQDEWQDLKNFIEGLEIDTSGVHVHPIVRLSHNPATGILETVREEKIDLLLIGWSRDAVNNDINAPSIINTLIRFAKCEVAVLHGAFPQQINRLVIPTDGGPNSEVAVSLSQALSEPGKNVTEVVHVRRSDDQSGLTQADIADILAGAQGFSDGDHPIQTRTFTADSIYQGIISAAEGSDLIVIGATQEDVLGRSYIGDIPARVSLGAPQSTVIVRGSPQSHYPWLGRFWDLVTSPLPTLSTERRAHVSERLRDAAVPNIDFFVLIVLSSTIATLGLLQNSAAVIIGAMLVAPLMSPILAIAMGMVLGEFRVLRTAFEATLKGVLLAIFVAMIMTFISPIEADTLEIVVRTTPNVLDLVIALASGAAAGYAISRQELSAALPGVAIAAALVPPLGVVGYGIATSQLQIASGALLLFTTNLIAIVFAASLIFLALGFHPTRAGVGGLVRGLQITSLFLVIILLVLGTTTFVTTRNLSRQQQIESIITQEVVANAAEIQNINIQREGDGYRVTATILDFEGNRLTPQEIEQLEAELSEVVDGTVVIDAVIISATQAEIGLESLGKINLLTQFFEEVMDERKVEISSLAVEDSGSGFIIETTLIIYPQSDFEEPDLARFSDELGAVLELPISIRATILHGELTEIEGAIPATATPTLQP